MQADIAAEPVAPPVEGFKRCEAGTHELVIDYKGVLSLPFDTDNDAIKCVRALIFCKGKAVHVPNMSGQYVTTAPYSLVMAPCLVWFALASRPPELCISFMDFSATNGGLAGVAVESLALPLKMQGKDKYRTLSNIAQANTVIGFSPIPSGETSISLSATLKCISPFKQFGVSTLNEVTKLVGQPLAARISKLRDHAQARILAQVTAIAKAGDHQAAASCQGQWTARLEWIVNVMNTLPPINYDARLESRITVLEIKGCEQLGHRPDWLASPLKQQLIQGASEMLQRSRFIEQRPPLTDGAAATAALEPGAGEAAAVAAARIVAAAMESGDERSMHSFGEDDDELEAPMAARENRLADEDDDDSEALLPSTRKRKAPDAFMPGGTSPKRSKAVTEKAAGVKVKAAAKCSEPSMINPRNKMPYKRGGPYNRLKVEKVSKATKLCVPADKTEEIIALRAELTAAKNQIMHFELQLELEKRTLASSVLAAKNEMLAKMSNDAMEHFMRGLNHGSRLSGGIGIMSHMPSPFSAAGSTSGS